MKNKFISESYFSDSQTDDTETAELSSDVSRGYMYQMMIECDFKYNNSEVQAQRVRLIEDIIRRYDSLLGSFRSIKDYERPWPTIENNYPICYIFLKFDCDIRSASGFMKFMRIICESFIWGTVQKIKVKNLYTEKIAFVDDTSVFGRNFHPEHPKQIQPCQIYYMATILCQKPVDVFDYTLRMIFRGNMPAFPFICGAMGNDYKDVIMPIPGDLLDAVMLNHPVSEKHLNELCIGVAAMDYTISEHSSGVQVSAAQPQRNNFKSFLPNSSIKDIYDRISEGNVLVRDIKIVYKPMFSIVKIFMACGLFLNKFRYQMEEFFLIMECQSVSDTEDELCMLFDMEPGMLPGAYEV